jgi:hypothetical protein
MLCWIYKLIHKNATNDDMVYIGSTCDVARRMYIHKSRCTNPNDIKHNYKVYKYIRENGGFEEWKYEILDEIEVPLKKCEERDKYEDNYIRKYDAVNKLNGCYSIWSSKQYYEDNRDKMIEYQKEYRKNNVEEIKKQKKIYCEKNVDIMKERKKEYYEKNVNYMLEKRKEKKCCNICGSFVTKYDIKKHQRTQKCINFKNLTI